MGGGMSWVWIWPILVLIGLSLLVYVVVRLSQSNQPRSGPSAQETRTARQILDERYARGEIDEQEYHKRREALQ
jgi:putative membrane protein